MRAAGRVKLKSEHSVLNIQTQSLLVSKKNKDGGGNSSRMRRNGSRTNVRKHQRQTKLLKCVKLQIVNTGVSEIEDISKDKSKLLEANNPCEIRDDKCAIDLDHNYAKKPRRVVFTSVSVYYFRRVQGFCTQPSDGEVALGMEMNHSHYQRLKVKDVEEEDDILHEEEVNTEEEEDTPPLFCVPCKELFPNICDMSGLTDLPLSSPPSGLFTNLLSTQDKVMTILSRDIFSHPPPSPPRSFLGAPALFRQTRRTGTPDDKRRQDISVETLLTRCRQSFQSFHSGDGGDSDHIDTVKILEIVPDYITRQTLQNNSRRFKRRRRRKQECGSRGLKSLTHKARISLLRSHGIHQIDFSESSTLPSSSGCSCAGPCYPRSCSCAREGVQCCVETHEGPCKCAGNGCFNQEGRRVYDTLQVDIHFIITLMDKGGGMKLEENS